MTWRDRIAAVLMAPSMSQQDQAFADMRRSPNVEDRRDEGLMPEADYNAIAGDYPRLRAYETMRVMAPQPPPTPLGIDLGANDLDSAYANNLLRRQRGGS